MGQHAAMLPQLLGPHFCMLRAGACLRGSFPGERRASVSFSSLLLTATDLPLNYVWQRGQRPEEREVALVQVSRQGQLAGCHTRQSVTSGKRTLHSGQGTIIIARVRGHLVPTECTSERTVNRQMCRGAAPTRNLLCWGKSVTSGGDLSVAGGAGSMTTALRSPRLPSASCRPSTQVRSRAEASCPARPGLRCPGLSAGPDSGDATAGPSAPGLASSRAPQGHSQNSVWPKAWAPRGPAGRHMNKPTGPAGSDPGPGHEEGFSVVQSAAGHGSYSGDGEGC